MCIFNKIIIVRVFFFFFWFNPIKSIDFSSLKYSAPVGLGERRRLRELSERAELSASVTGRWMYISVLTVHFAAQTPGCSRHRVQPHRVSALNDGRQVVGCALDLNLITPLSLSLLLPPDFTHILSDT